FVQLAKDKPGTMSFGSAGNGSTPHLAGERFASLAGIEMLHVPYGGVAPAIVDVMAGRVDMISVGLAPVQPGIEAGKLRVLAVAAPKRLAALPDLPTTAEAGVPGYEISTWFGFFAPTGTDPKIIETLNA